MATVALSGIITPSNVVTAASTTTLTNKTLTAPTIASANLTTALTLAGAAGTNGQVLTSAGSGLPTWTTVGSGALTLLSTVTASASATVDIETTFSSTYDAYVLEVSGLRVSTAAGLKIRMKLSGAYVTTGTYSYHTIYSGPANTALDSGQSAITELQIVPVGIGSSASISVDLTIHIKNPASTTLLKQIYYTGVGTDSTPEMFMVFGAGQNTGTGALTGIRFFPNAGNIASGTFRLYGIANS